MKKILIMAILMFAFYSISIGQTYELSIDVDGFATDDGVCRILLFTEENSFGPREDSFKHGSVEIDSGKCSYVFTELPKGNYAVIVYHDENNDKELETNFIGMPQEGIGNSNNHDGFPSFGKSEIRIESNQNISISIRYL